MNLKLEKAKRFLPDPVREFLLLERAEQAILGLTAEQHERMRGLIEAADRRYRAAESLTGDDEAPAALLLNREAATLSIWALLVSRGRSVDESVVEPLAALRALESLMGEGSLPTPPPEFEQAKTVISELGPLAVDDLDPAEVVTWRRAIETLVAWMRGLVETRTRRELRWSRILRIGASLAVVVGLLTFGITRLLSSSNIAHGKPVTMSSRRPNAPAGSGPEGLPPSGAVDGAKHGAYDVCTNSEPNPWITIDLGQTFKISKVVVYNRGDCCWDDRSLPMVVEVSDNNQSFREAARRTTSFTEASPWSAPLNGTHGRYVRIRVDSTTPKEIVVSEIEVFGRP